MPLPAIVEGLIPNDPYLYIANEILGYPLQTRVVRAHQTGSKIHTALAQPAIYVASSIAFRRSVEAGETYDYLAGHSLGEFAALAAGGAFTFKRGLMLVKKRAEAMEIAARAHPGGMAAVLGLGRDQVVELAERSGLDVANDNAPGQIVLSGADPGLEAVAGMVSSEGGRIVRLDVAGPFHTAAMDPAAAELSIAIDATDVRSPRTAVMSNLTARPYRAPGEIRKLLVDQVNHPIRWRECMEWMWREGVREFVDLGPGRVVEGLARRTLRGMEVGVARRS